MEGIVVLLLWALKLALLGVPVFLVFRSKALQGKSNWPWIVAFIAAYYLAPVPADLFMKASFPPDQPVDLRAVMTASNLEFASHVLAFWLVYVAFRLVTRSSARKSEETP